MVPSSVKTFAELLLIGAATVKVVKLAESLSIMAPNEIVAEKSVAVAVAAVAALVKVLEVNTFMPTVEDRVVEMRLVLVDQSASKTVSEVPTFNACGVPALTSATYKLAPVDLVPDR